MSNRDGKDGKHQIVICQDNDSGGVTYLQSRDSQSMADAAGISTAPYIHALYGFVRQAAAHDVLVIGCGGGTLATMLSRARLGVTLVDIDPLSFAVARRYFHLPHATPCHVADGAAFLRASKQRYDAIVLDAYAGGHLPRHLAASPFFALAKSRLRRGGVLLINVIVRDDDDHAPDRIGFRLKQSFRRVALLDQEGEDGRNAVLVAGGRAAWKPPRLTMRPKSGAAAVAATLKVMDFRDLRA